MKLPERIKEVTISKYQSKGPFPPLGFVNIEEGNDGAGNNYGLYWEIGKEDNFPIICWFDHDEGKLEPSFPNLSSFIRWSKMEDKTEFEFNEDEELFFPYHNRAKLLNKRKNHEEAINYLEHSLQMFREYTPSWYLLNLQYLKTEKIEKLTKYFPEIMKSNWIFGEPEIKEVKFMNEAIAYLKSSNDPIIKKFEKLRFENSWRTGLKLNFNVLKEIISEYHEQNDYLAALKLKQNYGYAMFYQNEDTKAKYNFNFEEWQLEFEEYSRKYLNERKYSS